MLTVYLFICTCRQRSLAISACVMQAGQALIVQRTLMNVSATHVRMGGAAPMGSMATPASAPVPGQDHSARLPSKVQPEPPPLLPSWEMGLQASASRCLVQGTNM